MRMIHYRDQITHARILTNDRNHCFLLTVNVGDIVAVKSGFASGYGGEGPRGFSYVLQLLEAHGADIEEYKVTADVIERVDMSALRQRDLDMIERARPIRPQRWHEYIVDERFERGKYAELWQEFYPVIPLAIVDARITDLAMRFYEAPDDCLVKGYRRLEDIVRKRIGSEQHGLKLFQNAFLGEEAKLRWPGTSAVEQAARCTLFTAAFGAFRNPRAHRELEADSNEQTMEFLLLNQLYSLERKTVETSEE
jgi:hypothetical protein